MSGASMREGHVKRAVIGPVLDQHVAEVEILWNARRRLSKSAHVDLVRIGRFDDRIAAHQDGCIVSGAEGLKRVGERLAEARAPQAFSIALIALDSSAGPLFEQVIAVAETIADAAIGLRSAVGWVNRDRLARIARDLLTSPAPFRRALGLAACRLHGVDPGPALLAALKDPSPLVRAEALRTAGTVGRHQLVSTIAAIEDDDPDCQFWAVWAAVMLGDRLRALETLTAVALQPGPYRARAFRLSLQAMSPAAAHGVLKTIATEPDQLRWLIQGSGITGDPAYVPWLINHMAADKTARLAGEAFSLMTGTDLAWLDLERKPPENIEAGPNDDPNDPNVEMDDDDGLPWPDPQRVQRWWDAIANRYQAGERYFMGGPVIPERCVDVLKSGYQRQRGLAAHYLSLLEPGTPLFNTNAPAWRQQKLLAAMLGSDDPEIPGSE
jgi:uncharacterized protein (TIGR02270 family)